MTGAWHTHTTAACALLTLPFALVVCRASGGGGVVSLGLRRRPFSWPLSASEEPSLPSARFRARSVFHERDFLYGTGTTETSTGQSKRSYPARCGCNMTLRTSSIFTIVEKKLFFYGMHYLFSPTCCSVILTEITCFTINLKSILVLQSSISHC